MKKQGIVLLVLVLMAGCVFGASDYVPNRTPLKKPGLPLHLSL